jgi:hypothetical protein
MAVNLPVQNYFTRVQGPSIWVRPADWPVITDVDNNVQYLISDQGDSNCSILTSFTRTSGSQDIIIDWGDGTTDTISTTANTRTNHTYTVGSGTPCSLGYTTFKIRIYFTGTGVSVLTTASIAPLYLAGNSASSQVCYVLEAYFGNGTTPSSPCNFHSIPGSAGSRGLFTALKYIKYPSTVSWTSIQDLCRAAGALARVRMPISMSSVTNSGNAFTSCFELEELTFPSNATGMNSFTSMFQNCYNLQNVTFPTALDNCTTFGSALNGCSNLRNLTLPSINNCSNFQSAFANLTQLEWFRFTSMPTVNASISFTTAFGNCVNLQNIYFPATASSVPIYNFQQCFNFCPQLKSIIFPPTLNVSTFLAAFGNCTSLITAVLPITMPSCTTISGVFQGCASLKNVTLPNTTASLNMSNAFSGCSKLETITIPNTLNINNLGNAFTTCVALKTVNWNPGAQNSLTTLGSTFQSCFNLTSITLPTSMTALNSLQSVFASCFSLTSVTFPSSLNAVTSMLGAFSNCYKIQNITLPTSMAALNSFQQTFTGCFSLKSIVLPNTVSAATTIFNQTFFSCYALESVVFPGAAQLSAVTDINSMFANCNNLKTITNLDKIGSLTATPLVNGSGNINNRFTSVSFAAPFTTLQLQGSSSGKADVQSVRLLNTSAGQWTGSSPQINVSFTNMSTAQLVQLFNDMAAQGTVTSKTINITSATGAAGLTAGDRSIITSLGWTITG